MLILLVYMFIIMLISLLLLLIPMFMKQIQKKWLNKLSSVECGMSMNYTSRKPFSIRFFLLMILFIIFDVELILIIAIPILMPWKSQMITFLTMFISFLLIGLFYEWIEGSLNWKM